MSVLSRDGAQVAYPQGSPGYAAPDRPDQPWVSRGDLRAAVAIVVVLAVSGVLLGLVWQAISPRTRGFVLLPHAIVPEESESLIATDGRFWLLTAGVAIVVSVAAWFHRSSRGPVVAVALAAGGLLGALLTDLVGRATGGGASGGALHSTITMQVTVHARGLLLVEPVLALFVYEIFVLCAKRDDLGRAAQGRDTADGFPPPDGYQQAYQPAPWPSPAVGPEQ